MFDEDVGRTVAIVPAGTVLHRARVGFMTGDRGSPQPFKGADIGAPPPDKAKPGRANTEGDVVLYVADQETTAVGEVRPWRRSVVSVAELRTNRDLKIVDPNNILPTSHYQPRACGAAESVRSGARTSASTRRRPERIARTMRPA
jgi:RES domain-containing protein